MKVSGLKEVEKSLRQLEKVATRRTVARNALKSGGQVLIDRARSLVPVDEGELKSSLSVSTKLSKRQRKKHKKRDQIEVFAGAGPHSKATMQEYGNRNHKAQPFMRPAFDGTKRQALTVITGSLRLNLAKALKRQSKAKKK